MSERQASYQCTRIHNNSGEPCQDCGNVQNTKLCNVTSDHGITLTISPEWADFLTRAQTAHNEWRKFRCVSHMALIDWRNLGLRSVSLDDRP